MKYIKVVIFILFTLNFISCEDEKNGGNCSNQCSKAGEYFCISNRVFSCQENSDRCLILKEIQTCDSGKICRDGGCIDANCEDECYLEDERSCENSLTSKVCGNFDEDICLEWQYRICSEDGVCKDGYCGSSSDSCENIDCSDKGRCLLHNDGGVYCECDQGYSGGFCENCEEGYQDYDDDGSCLPTCEVADLDCNDKGFCSDSSGEPICVCDEGYRGEKCDKCKEDYQDNNSDGECLLSCESDTNFCGLNGICDDLSGVRICNCNDGYSGEQCNICDDGYQDNDNNGTCLTSCKDGVINCNNKGICDDSSGVIKCNCNIGYSGENCENCDEGYQDNDSDGTCLISCDLFTDSCENGGCQDSSGVAICVCNDGYSGENCGSCDEGYQDNDNNGTCLEECNEYSCNQHGICIDDSGVKECLCNTGYSGDNCENCKNGYHMIDDVCIPNCESDHECNDNNICTGEEYCDFETGACRSINIPYCSWGCEPETGCIYYKNCNELHNNFPSLPTGVYQIKPEGENPIQVYCDMDHDGGGWTLIAYVSASQESPSPGVNSVGVPTSTQYSVDANGILFSEIYISHDALSTEKIFDLQSESSWNSSLRNIDFTLSNGRFAIFRHNWEPMVCINSTRRDCLNQSKSEVYGAVSEGDDTCYQLQQDGDNSCGGWGGPISPGDTTWPVLGGKIMVR